MAIPGSDLNLVYLSSRAAGYKPILKVLLTQDRLPFGLMKVHLMVAVMGRQFQKSFPAFPDLSYTFIWDKTDAYNQKVFGLAEAVGEFPPRRRCCISVSLLSLATFGQWTWAELLKIDVVLSCWGLFEQGQNLMRNNDAAAEFLFLLCGSFRKLTENMRRTKQNLTF